MRKHQRTHTEGEPAKQNKNVSVMSDKDRLRDSSKLKETEKTN